MAAPLSPHVARAFELLADGEWHPRDKIYQEMWKVITPGIAVRYSEKLRKVSGVRANGAPRPDERVIPRSQEFLIMSGKKALARDGLRQHRIEKRCTEAGVEVRLRPAMPQHNSREARIARGEPVPDTPVRPKRKAPVPALAPAPDAPAAPHTYRNISSHLRRAFEVLADGEWHPREQVLEAMIEVVDKDNAIAVAERRRQAAAQLRGAHVPERRKRRSTEFLIATGSRTLATNALLHAVRIEKADIDGEKMVRLRPTQYGRGSTTEENRV